MYKIVQDKIDSQLKKARELSKSDVLAAIQTYYQILILNNRKSFLKLLDHLPCFRELAKLYTEIGDLSPAIACLQYSLALKNDILVEDELHDLLLLRGQTLLEQGDVSNFLEGTEYEQFGNYMDFTNQSLQKAYSFILTNHLPYAFLEVQKVISADSTNIDAILLRAKLHFAMGRSTLAHLDYWSVHSMQPDIQEIQEFLLFITPKINQLTQEAKLYLVQKENDRCSLNVRKGLDLCPHNKELLLMKAYLHRNATEYEQALKCLDAALKQDVKNKDIQKQISITYNEMAMLLFDRQNYEDALTLFNEALKYRGDDWGILVNRGDTNKCLGKLNDSIADYRAAYNLDKNPTVCNRLAIVLHSFGVEFFNKRMFQKACDAFSQALELCESVDILYKRGRAYQQLQQYSLALKDFERAVVIDPSHYEAQNQVKQLSSNNKK